MINWVRKTVNKSGFYKCSYFNTQPEEVTKKGQLEKKSSNIGSRGWKQHTFILNKDTLRYVHEHTHEVGNLIVLTAYVTV